MVTLGVSSQIDTQNEICFSEEVSRFIIKDLISGDIAKEEVKLLRIKTGLYIEKITLQDDHIEDLKVKASFLESKVFIQDSMVKNLNKQNKHLRSNLKNQKNKTNILGVASVGALVAIVAGVLIISK